MKNKNVYKPRYKIAFQAKSKNFIYKNCRMRRFFNIRGRKIQRRGYFKRIVLVFNNMKWAVARRYIKPYRKSRRAVRKSYRRIFYTKQQIRQFYGKGKELNFRHFLRNFLVSVRSRNNSFFAALERRLDMVIYRLRFLPTIFACNQLIHHYGVCVNNQIEKIPHSLIKLGDSITLAKAHWKPVFFYINKLILYRTYGSFIGARRRYKNLKKKVWALKKNKKFRRKNYALMRKQYKLAHYCARLKPVLNFYKHCTISGLNQNIYVNNLNLKKQRKRNKKEMLSLNDVTSFYNSNALNVKEISQTYESLKRKNILFNAIQKTLKKGIKSFRLFLKQRRQKKHTLKKWWWNQHYSFFLDSLTFNYSFTQTFNYLWMRLRLEEIRQLRHIVLTLYLKKKENNNQNKVDYNKAQEKNEFMALQDDEAYESIINILWEGEVLLKDNYLFLKDSLNASYKYLVRKRINKKKKRRYGLRRLFRFYVRQRYKKRRNAMTLRLNYVHWYLPKYFEFDFKTMTGFLMAAPSANDIYFPFRCTLKKIYSFYRSRGY